MTGGEIPPHRCLFHTYTYQYHLMEFSLILISAVRRAPRLFFLALAESLRPSPQLEYVTRLERQRPKTRLWFPSVSLSNFFS
jgi:hypothetical protein